MLNSYSFFKVSRKAASSKKTFLDSLGWMCSVPALLLSYKYMEIFFSLIFASKSTCLRSRPPEATKERKLTFLTFLSGEPLPLMAAKLTLLKNSVQYKYVRVYMDQAATGKQDPLLSRCTVFHLGLDFKELRLSTKPWSRACWHLPSMNSLFDLSTKNKQNKTKQKNCDHDVHNDPDQG